MREFSLWQWRKWQSRRTWSLIIEKILLFTVCWLCQHFVVFTYSRFALAVGYLWIFLTIKHTVKSLTGWKNHLTITHKMIDLEIFGQNQALEKPPRGKPVRERERLYSSWKKTKCFTVKIQLISPTQSPAGCPRFCAKAASISKQISSQKIVQNNSH